MTCTGRLRLSWRKPARRLAWRSSSACTAAAQRCAVERPLQSQAQLDHVDVGRLRVIAAHGTAAPPATATSGRMSSICGYSRSNRSISSCESATNGRSEGLRPPAPGCCRVPHQRLQRLEPALAPDRAPPPRRAAPAQRSRSRSAWRRRPIERQRIDLERVSKRHGGIATAERHRLGSRSPVRRRRRRKRARDS